MKTFNIAVLAGDGIGPEIMAEAIKVLKFIETQSSVKFELDEVPFGACAWFDSGNSFPEQTIAACDKADAILKGTIGLNHEESKQIPIEQQPERGALLPMRKRYQTYANFRPITLPSNLAHFSPLKKEVIGNGIDFVIIRELVGGLYFGSKNSGINSEGKRFVNETLEYDEVQIRQVLEVAFQLSMERNKLLTNVHKSNVLKSSVLWNEIVEEINLEYPEVQVENILVDAAATYLCLQPTRFDVLVMENMFGDILSDQCGGILGSLGLMPSACVGPKKSYYEPSHGSAPDIAGQGIANPYSMLGSVAMMLEMSFGMKLESQNLWRAMQGVLSDGFTTADLSSGEKSEKKISTSEFGDKVISKLEVMK